MPRALCPTCSQRGCDCLTPRVRGVRPDPHAEALAWDAQRTACRALQAESETRYAAATAASRKAGHARRGIIPPGFAAKLVRQRAARLAKDAARPRPGEATDPAAPCAWCRGERTGPSRWCTDSCKGRDRRDREKQAAAGRRSA